MGKHIIFTDFPYKINNLEVFPRKSVLLGDIDQYDDHWVMNTMNHGIYEYRKHYIRSYVYSHQISAKSVQ